MVSAQPQAVENDPWTHHGPRMAEGGSPPGPAKSLAKYHAYETVSQLD